MEIYPYWRWKLGGYCSCIFGVFRAQREGLEQIILKVLQGLSQVGLRGWLTQQCEYFVSYPAKALGTHLHGSSLPCVPPTLLTLPIGVSIPACTAGKDLAWRGSQQVSCLTS